MIQSATGNTFSSTTLANNDVVAVTITSGFGCTGAASQSTLTMTVIPGLTASFISTTPDTQCVVGHSFGFLANTPAGTIINWSFGPDGIPSSSNVNNPSGITFFTPGPKTVTMTVTQTTAPFCSLTVVKDLLVRPNPTASFVQPLTQCLTGNSFTFVYNGSANPTAIYSWNFGSFAQPSTSLQQNPSNIVFTQPGTYPVTLSVSVNGCSDDTTINVTVDTLLVVDLGGNVSACISDPKPILDAGVVGAISYEWSLDGSPIGGNTQTNTK